MTGPKFNSIPVFIISVMHQQPEGQLQMQHKGRQNNKYNKTTYGYKKLHGCYES
jgi:hypothetical protein